jgi:hypothetical protein
MATDDDRQVAEASEFQKKHDAKVATAVVKKRYDTARTRVLATTMLLEEEERAATVLTEEGRTATALIEPPSPTPPPAPTGCTAPSDDDYEVAVITNIHVHGAGVQNICSLISLTLDLTSMHYTWWHDNVMHTLRHYSLSLSL